MQGNKSGVVKLATDFITILVENTAQQPGHLAEHGFAALLNVGGRKLLFDTGAGQALIPNAKAMGIDLTSVSAVALSHGHYDHTGGLKDFLRLHHNPVTVYAHPDLFSHRFSISENDPPRYSGIDWTKGQLEQVGAVFDLTATPTDLGSGLFLTGQIPRTVPYEHISDRFQVKTAAGWKKDEILDDQALVIETKTGLVVISGCAHAGLINTLSYAQELSDNKKIAAFFGGTHLIGATDERIKSTIKALAEFDLSLIGAGHCTGFKASALLFSALRDLYRPIPVGSVFELD